jgi:hypothetical protein
MKARFQEMAALFQFKPLPPYSYFSNQVYYGAEEWASLCLFTHHRPGQRSFWGFTRIIKDKFRRTPAFKLVGLTIKIKSEKADEIASKFSLAHDNTLLSELSTSVQDTCSVLNSNAFNDDPTQYTSPRKMRTLKSRKAPDCDGEPNICLKNIFNSSLNLCCFSNQWRHATVIPIPKPGKDHWESLNFHLISLLSSMRIFFERIILIRLNAFISGHNVFSNHQFGFRVASQEQKNTGEVY